MMLGHQELSEIIVKLGKKLGIKPNEEISINDFIKKIINRDLNYVIDKKEFNLLEASLTSSFFINNIDIEIDKELIKSKSKDFDLDLLVGIRQMNKEYELTDFNKNKIRVPIESVTVSTKESIPLELFLKVI